MKPTFEIAIVVSLLSNLLSACGPASDTVVVRLRTGLEKAGKTPNLMSSLSTPPNAFALPANRCIQKNLYAGFSAGDKSDDHLETLRVPIVVDYSAGPYDITDTFLQNAEVPEITLKIPRGIPVGVGILGSLASSERLDAGGVTCADFDNSFVPYVSSSIIGHTRIVANGPMDVPLNVWVTPTNIVPQATPAAGCSDRDHNQNCPFLDYFKFACSNCTSDGRNLMLEYAFDRNAPEKRVIQMLPASRANLAYIPNILPVRVSFLDASLRPIASHVFTSNDLTGGGNRTAGRNFTPAETGSATQTITLTEWSSKIIPTITAASLQAFTGQGTGANAINLVWNHGTYIEQYTVKYSTSSGGPYTTIQNVPGYQNSYNLTALTASGTYYIVIEGSNSQGSTPVDSNERAYIPLGTMSAPTATGGASTTISVSWSHPAGASAAAVTYSVEKFSAGTNASLGSCGSVAFPSTSLTCSGLTTGQSYYFKVSADNGSYGGYTVSGTTSSVNAP